MITSTLFDTILTVIAVGGVALILGSLGNVVRRSAYRPRAKRHTPLRRAWRLGDSHRYER